MPKEDVCYLGYSEYILRVVESMRRMGIAREGQERDERLKLKRIKRAGNKEKVAHTIPSHPYNMTKGRQ